MIDRRTTSFERHAGVVAGSIVLACVGAGAIWDRDGLGPNLLLSGVLMAGLGAGALFFMAANRAARARWDESLQPVPVALTGLLPLAALLLALGLWVSPTVYEDWSPAAGAGLRERWLTREFVLLRSLGYTGLWWIVALRLRRDAAGQGAAGAMLVILTLSGWLAASDWLMSLSPGWTSTVYGLYVLVGFVESALAVILLACVAAAVRHTGRQPMDESRLQDLATLLFAMACVWGYLWYSQYMLIWYTNQPHETQYYLLRLGPDWRALFWGVVALKWAVPFTLLLSRAGKRMRSVLSVAAVSVLLGHWLDLYVAILPAMPLGSPAFGAAEVLLAFASAAAVVAATWERKGSGTLESK